MDSSEVELTVAARPASLSTVRAVATQVARLGRWTPELAADLVIAVDEACSALIAKARDHSLLQCRFDVEPDSVRFRAEVGSSAVTVPAHDSLYWRVVSSVTDAVASWVDGNGLLHVELRCRA
ncbi:ATP-binding protein [Saccharothrix coeruleofusca]|uniref:Anti-sigma factor n=1 Tax=Saccharothrix coeruleofusca TaxID=33919 RepID=A0A918AP62_9PSEU|nr:ATP-binding protein [Saccharothrix coeruleofusca]MBP2338007.1 serine/threonine-protein kinase RsbW [Saccharothrix coeruleofusca]GGP63708.1 anti-sigma factor [Saccharothrix coeruleofusca]